jgi:glycosyltransferase involved in cell wall biosynthesis
VVSARATTTLAALERFVGDGHVLSGIHLARDLADATVGAPADDWVEALMGLVGGRDAIAAIGAVHAMAGLAGEAADEALAGGPALSGGWAAPHAAWGLSARSPHRASMVALAGIVGGAGGFAGMLAQRTLEGWAASDAHAVAVATERALDVAGSDDARARLVETIGLAPSLETLGVLRRVAADVDEGFATRAAAVAALGDRNGDPLPLLALTAADDDRLAARAVLALHDRGLADLPAPSGPGLRIGQVFVHADFTVDDRAGTADHGGIATLLELLAVELGRLDRVADVVSIGRGGPEDALLNGWSDGMGPARATIPFGPPGAVGMQQAWPARVEIERGMRRVLRTLPGLDLLHLRMADVGTLAAARVARRAGVPIVFTAAPDPHGVIDAMERNGELTRASFGTGDTAEHWWFRARMVERLVVQAEHVVLFPRPAVRRELARLLGRDELEGRSTVVPEGVHATTVLAASKSVTTRPMTELGPAVDDLARALARLPSERRRLPLVISVGRLHPAKRMAEVARAWWQTLAASTNLVIVGGDLSDPSPVERAVLGAIDAVATESDGLIVLGRQAHGDVARLLEVAAGHAAAPLPCGVYVAGARKEEFGLAIVEALAAGLPVVAPAAGGPATYVRDGVDGVLVHEASVEALGDAMRRALDLAPVAGRAAAATARVLDELTIERMAATLGGVYGEVAATRARTS